MSNINIDRIVCRLISHVYFFQSKIAQSRLAVTRSHNIVPLNMRNLPHARTFSRSEISGGSGCVSTYLSV